ncbi:hypothetical protein HUO09_17310 [Vibrio sp. Y2-5]|uniref:hypothetical protein n=1 Tax=Vibrio sp. Y2-5 TaxID=2743977 RepID=UPI00166179DE|nr:hypothetical protein [Vibrio sp. Y2-5]MBD0788115.1 hypothetical protein [Vibrio sp. Y2-5]
MWRGLPHNHVIEKMRSYGLPERYQRAVIKKASCCVANKSAGYGLVLPLFTIDSCIKPQSPYRLIDVSKVEKFAHGDLSSIDSHLKALLGTSFRQYDIERLRLIYARLTRRKTLLNIGNPKLISKSQFHWHLSSGNNAINRNKGFSPSGLSNFGFLSLADALDWLNSISRELVWRDGYTFKVRGLKGSFAVTNKRRELPSDHVNISKHHRHFPAISPEMRARLVAKAA